MWGRGAKGIILLSLSAPYDELYRHLNVLTSEMLHKSLDEENNGYVARDQLLYAL